MSVDTVDKLSEFDDRCSKVLQTLTENQRLWRDALEYGVELPYGATSDASKRMYNNLAAHFDYDEETKTMPLDVQETQRRFARVIRWAKKRGYTIEKKYDDNEFKVIVTTPDDRVIDFYSTRQVVCKQVQTGTKVIPEQVVPVYEYQCDKVAFLSVEV
jgi:hypothetical protein